MSLDAVFEKRRSQPRQFEFFAIALCVMFNRLHASHSTTLAFWRSGVEYTFFRADVHLVVHDTKNYGSLCWWEVGGRDGRVGRATDT